MGEEKVRKVPLTGGKYALVDADDYDRVSKHKWYFHESDGYAARMEPTPSGRRMVLLHRFILGDDAEMVDHINGDRLDCRKENLRPATNATNQRNRAPTGGRRKGVTYYKDKGLYAARIQRDGKSVFLGYFDTEDEAAAAYDGAARGLHGEFARTNKEE